MAELDHTADDLIRAMRAMTRGFDTAGDVTTRGSTVAAKAASMFEKSLSTATATVKSMHGGMDQLNHSMYRLSKMFIGGEVLFELFKGAQNLTAQYSKLTNIGETFGGSILKLGQQAGESGLSLEQFSAVLMRNSTATAELRNEATQLGITQRKTMGGLTLGVRDLMTSAGFYGMSLTELTGTTSDYVETLRQTGALTKMTDKQREISVQMLVKTSTEWAGVFGKSREEILKLTQEAMKDPGAAARLAALGPEVTEKFQKLVSFLASLPGEAGQLFSQMAGQAFGQSLGVFNTQFGKSLLAVGEQNIALDFQGLLEKVRRNQEVSAQEQADFYEKTFNDLSANAERLTDLTIEGSGVEQQATQTLAVLKQLRMYVDANGKFDKQRYIEAVEQNKKDAAAKSKLTTGMLLLESTFNKITGAFRGGFYDALEKGLGSLDSAKWKTIIDSLTDTMTKVGTAFGTLLATVLQPKIFDALGDALITLAKWATDAIEWFGTDTGSGTGWSKVKSGLETLGSWIVWLAGWMDTGLTATLGKSATNLTEVVLAISLILAPIRTVLSIIRGIGWVLRGAWGAFSWLARLVPGMASGGALRWMSRLLGGPVAAAAIGVDIGLNAGKTEIATDDQEWESLIPGYSKMTPEQKQRARRNLPLNAPANPATTTEPTPPVTPQDAVPSPVSETTPLFPTPAFAELSKATQSIAVHHQQLAEAKAKETATGESTSAKETAETVATDTRGIRDYSEVQTVLLAKVSSLLESMEAMQRRQAEAVLS